MEVTGLFSEGFDVLKSNPVVAAPLVAAGVLIGLLRLAAGGMMLGAGLFGMGWMRNLFALGAFLGAMLLLLAVAVLLNLLATGMTYVLADQALGGKAELGVGLSRTAERLTSLLAVAVLVGVIVFVGTLLFVLPGLLLAYLLMFAILLVMLEGKGAVESLSLSINMVTGHLSETLVFAVIALVVLFVASAISALLAFVPILGVVLLSPVVSGGAAAYVNLVLVKLYRELTK